MFTWSVTMVVMENVVMGELWGELFYIVFEAGEENWLDQADPLIAFECNDG